jgi:hypothetical protein
MYKPSYKWVNMVLHMHLKFEHVMSNIQLSSLVKGGMNLEITTILICLGSWYHAFNTCIVFAKIVI